MLEFAGEVRDSLVHSAGLEELERSERLLARLDRLAVAAAARPLMSLRVLVIANFSLAAFFVLAGIALFGDPAEFFRELMPGTWLSFAELAFVAAVAWSIHQRLAKNGGWRRYDNFWALSTGVFVVLALDEITQATVFVGNWLSQDLGLSPAGGFRDLDAVLLVLLLIGCGLVLLRRVGALFQHRRALALLVVGGLLGVCSQSLDSFVKATEWEFVTEETFKLGAEPFMVAGYLAALADVLRRRRASAEREG